jgi:hypothetical protein
VRGFDFPRGACINTVHRSVSFGPAFALLSGLIDRCLPRLPGPYEPALPILAYARRLIVQDGPDARQQPRSTDRQRSTGPSRQHRQRQWLPTVPSSVGALRALWLALLPYRSSSPPQSLEPADAAPPRRRSLQWTQQLPFIVATADLRPAWTGRAMGLGFFEIVLTCVLCMGIWNARREELDPLDATYGRPGRRAGLSARRRGRHARRTTAS